MIGFLAALVLPLGLLIYSCQRTLRRGINLGDEGYLVYGAQEVLRGHVPIRDFRAYDPGRYYWCALWMRVFGRGFIAVRVAMAVVSALSIVLVVTLMSWGTGSLILASASACLSLIWMRPSHKQVEVFFALAGCGVLFALLTGGGSPMLLGCFGAVAAVFGLNLAAYFVGSAALVVVFGVMMGLIPLGVAVQFVVGLLIGAVCLGALALLVPGMARAYWDRKVAPIFKRGATNLPQPRPWVWASDPRQLREFSTRQSRALKVLFTGMLPAYAGVIILIWALGETHGAAALVLVLACCGITYFHHWFSRPDLEHLFPTIQPALLFAVGVSHLMFGPVGALVVICILGGLSIALLRDQANFIFGPAKGAPKMVTFIAGSDRFDVLPGMKARLEPIRDLAASHSTPEDTLFAAPASPSMFALLNRRSAVYDTFPVYPATAQAQETMLRAFCDAKPKVAIVGKIKIDGRDDLAFENNYPKLFAHIQSHYDVAITNRWETVYLLSATT